MNPKIKAYGAAIGVWFIFLIIAFAFGTARELVVRPLLGELSSHLVGTFAVMAAFLTVITVFVLRVFSLCISQDFWRIGFLWFLMTVSFEFLFFHYVAGKSWSELLADYNIAEGRVWVLVLLTTLFGPPAIHAIIRRRNSNP